MGTWTERYKNSERGGDDRVAIHEAGHIVTGLALGVYPTEVMVYKGPIPIGGVTMFPAPGGETKILMDEAVVRYRAWVSRYVPVKLGGIASESIFNGREVSLYEAGAEGDVFQMISMLKSLGSPDPLAAAESGRKAYRDVTRILTLPESKDLVERFSDSIVGAPWFDARCVSTWHDLSLDRTLRDSVEHSDRVLRIDPPTMRHMIDNAMPTVEIIRKRLDLDAHGEYPL